MSNFEQAIDSYLIELADSDDVKLSEIVDDFSISLAKFLAITNDHGQRSTILTAILVGATDKLSCIDSELGEE